MSQASHRRAGTRFGALRIAAFRRLLGAGMAMQLGNWVQRVALLWVLFELTGSAVQLAGLAFVSGIFVLVVSPFAGPLADRFGARRVLMLVALLQGLAAGAVAAVVLAGQASVPVLYALAVAQGIGSSLNGPMRNLLVYDAVGRDLLRNGLALNSVTGNLMRVVGPSIGGTIVAARGADLAFGVQAALLMLAVVLVAKLRIEATRSLVRSGVWSELRAGLQHLGENHAVRVNIFVALLASTLVYPYLQFMPVVVVESLGGTARELGLMQSSIGVGSLVGLWYVVAGRGGTTTMLWAACVYMGLIASFAQPSALPVAFGMLVVAGVAHSIFSTLNQALVQLNAAEEYRARVMGLFSMTGGVEPFSTLLLGVIVEAAGVATALAVYSGVAAVVVLALAVHATPGALRRRAGVPGG